MSEAACAGLPIEMFFRPDGDRSPEDPWKFHARAVCRACPVRAECLEFALERNIRYGIWGGADERERARLRSRRSIVA